MKTSSQERSPEIAAFLVSHNFTEEQLSGCGLTWEQLQEIAALHKAMEQELLPVGKFVSDLLQPLQEIHSLKVRVKSPNNLVAKVIRKRLDGRTIDQSNYSDEITDLIGLRALHLFKDDWKAVHDFVTENWELNEAPIAYYRAGDPADLLESFQAADCNVKEHTFGYRSIHYIIKCQLSKRRHFVELQVRTIFKEGWSEIDHRVRYPRFSSDPHLMEFLRIFNRIAGSADEMGTFIKALVRNSAEQQRELETRDEAINQKEQELKKTISELTISNDDKKKLQATIDELRPKREPTNINSFVTLGNSLAASSSALSSLFSGFEATNATLAKMSETMGIHKRTCGNCGKTYEASVYSKSLLADRCPECQSKLLTGSIGTAFLK